MSFAHAAPTPPQIFVGPQVVLSVQSGVVLQEPPNPLAKHFPPLHFPDVHSAPYVHVAPGHLRQTPVVVLQDPLAQLAFVVHPGFPASTRQIPPTQTSPAAQVTVGEHAEPRGQLLVQGPLAAAAGASADCSRGVVQTTAPTTAPRCSRARRVRPCAFGAGAILGRPDSGDDLVSEPPVR